MISQSFNAMRASCDAGRRQECCWLCCLMIPWAYSLVPDYVLEIRVLVKTMDEDTMMRSRIKQANTPVFNNFYCQIDVDVD